MDHPYREPPVRERLAHWFWPWLKRNAWRLIFWSVCGFIGMQVGLTYGRHTKQQEQQAAERFKAEIKQLSLAASGPCHDLVIYDPDHERLLTVCPHQEQTMTVTNDYSGPIEYECKCKR